MNVDALDRYRKTLAESVVFAGLDRAAMNIIMASCRVVEASPGQLLLSEGAAGGGLYVILEGEVEFFLPERLAVGGRRPTRVRLNVLGSGRCFGEYGLIDDQPRSASARALTATRLCVLSTTEFRRIVEEHDRIGKIVYANLLRFLVGRLRAKDRELDLVLFADDPTR
jgi:CRP/FNR family transcriptional regulator, cyclic AMP receptor protein